VRKGVKSVKPVHLNSIPASDEDAVHTNGRAATRRTTLDHNMVYVPGKNFKLRPFYAHKQGAKRCKKCQTSPSQLDASVKDRLFIPDPPRMVSTSLTHAKDGLFISDPPCPTAVPYNSLLPPPPPGSTSPSAGTTTDSVVSSFSAAMESPTTDWSFVTWVCD
jgi:hypothetical protein